MMNKFTLVMLALVSAATCANADDLYKQVGPNGKIIFSDQPPPDVFHEERKPVQVIQKSLDGFPHVHQAEAICKSLDGTHGIKCVGDTTMKICESLSLNEQPGCLDEGIRFHTEQARNVDAKKRSLHDHVNNLILQMCQTLPVNEQKECVEKNVTSPRP